MASAPHEPFAITTEAEGDHAVLVVSGEIDLHACPALVEAGERLLAGGHDHLTIDCQRVRFLDSSAIRVLHLLREKAMAQGGTMKLAHPPKLVTAVVKMSGLADLLLDPS